MGEISVAVVAAVENAVAAVVAAAAIAAVVVVVQAVAVGWLGWEFSFPSSFSSKQPVCSRLNRLAAVAVVEEEVERDVVGGAQALSRIPRVGSEEQQPLTLNPHSPVVLQRCQRRRRPAAARASAPPSPESPGHDSASRRGWVTEARVEVEVMTA